MISFSVVSVSGSLLVILDLQLPHVKPKGSKQCIDAFGFRRSAKFPRLELLVNYVFDLIAHGRYSAQIIEAH